MTQIQLQSDIDVCGESIMDRKAYVCMKKVATVTVSIEETVSLGQGERGPDRDSYFPRRGRLI